MSSQEVIRAWKDVDYRENLSEAELMKLPESPAGIIELEGGDLDAVLGVGKDGEGDSYWPSAWSWCDCQSMMGSCDLFTTGCCSQYNC